MIGLTGYVAKELIRASPTAEVWLGLRRADEHPVVLKRYLREADGGAAKVELELATMRRLAGPSIPRPIEAAETFDGFRVLVQEHVRGMPLRDWARRSPVPISHWIRVARKLARVLARIHQARMVHCDVHPGNILVDPATLAVYLLDVGAARDLGSKASAHEPASVTTDAVGALAYIAPEQTGRMNRGVDFRSDLYALGATLYQALTGSPPFDGDTPLALIHAHMALRPASPSERRAGVPGALSRIVLKLLEKEPDDRYQSAHALADDLRTCADQLESKGRIEEGLALGRLDATALPRFSARLYGREREFTALESAFGRARGGRLQLVVLSGPAGAGKTVLVERLRQSAARASGYLAMSRSEADRTGLPYSAWSAAIESWVDQVLVKREDRLKFCQTRLRTSMQNVTAALFPVAPSLRLVSGDVPGVPTVGPKETRERLAHCVACFLRAAATAEHPLIIALEDLHWADSGSVKLLEDLIAADVEVPLLIVATLRHAPTAGSSDGSSRPIASLLAAVRAARVCAAEIELAPIGTSGVASMRADALTMPAEAAARLAQHVVARTGTALLSVQHYVRYMHEKGWLSHSEQDGWVWDEPAEGMANAPDSIISILVSQLENLPEAERSVLELASYAGKEFDAELLMELCDCKAADLQSPLIALTQRGLLATCRRGFRFTHGKILDAAEALTAPRERARVHGLMATRLLATLAPEERAERIFEITEHANQSVLTEDESERSRIIELNRAAGLRALEAGDGSTAHRYLAKAQARLRAEDWTAHPSLGFELSLECAESAFYADDMQAARRAIDPIDEGPLSPAEFSRVARIRVQLMLEEGPLDESVEFVRAALERLGLCWPSKPGPLRVFWAAWSIRWQLGRFRGGTLPGPGPTPELRFPIYHLLDASNGVLARGNPRCLCFRSAGC